MPRVTRINGYVGLSPGSDPGDSPHATTRDNVYFGVAGSGGGEEWRLPKTAGGRYTGGHFEFTPGDSDVDLHIEPPEPLVYIRKSGSDGILIRSGEVELSYDDKSVTYDISNVNPFWLDSSNGRGQTLWLRRRRVPARTVVINRVSVIGRLRGGKAGMTRDPIYFGFMSPDGGREWSLSESNNGIWGTSAGQTAFHGFAGGMELEIPAAGARTTMYLRKDGTDGAKFELSSARIEDAPSLGHYGSAGGQEVVYPRPAFWLSENQGNFVALDHSWWGAPPDTVAALELKVQVLNSTLGSGDYVFLGAIGSQGGREFRLKGLRPGRTSSFTFEPSQGAFWPFGGPPDLVYLRKDGKGAVEFVNASLQVTVGSSGESTIKESWWLDLRSGATLRPQDGTAVYLSKLS